MVFTPEGRHRLQERKKRGLTRLILWSSSYTISHKSHSLTSPPLPSPPVQFQIKREKPSDPKFANYSEGQRTRMKTFPAPCHCKHTEYLPTLLSSFYRTNKKFVTLLVQPSVSAWISNYTDSFIFLFHLLWAKPKRFKFCCLAINTQTKCMLYCTYKFSVINYVQHLSQETV